MNMCKVFPRHAMNFSCSPLLMLLKFFSRGKSGKRKYLWEFESDFARYIGVRHAFGVSSGRAALAIILDVLNFRKGTEVIISDYNFPPIPWMLKQRGLKPVFVDIHAESQNLDVSLIEEKVNSRTGAVLVTHLFGQPCKMDAIMDIAKRRGIKIIEDCAHVCGSEYKGKKAGSFGDLSYFSFGPGKNLPCFGGGMLVTNDESIARKIKDLYEGLPVLSSVKVWKHIVETAIFYLATHRKIFPYAMFPAIYLLSFLNSDLIDSLLEEKFDDYSLSINSKYKMTDLQAMAGLSQLKFLDKNNEKRINNACLLNEELKLIKMIKVAKTIAEAKNIYLYYRLLTEDRSSFRKKLLKKGIDTKKDDMCACSLLPIFKSDRQGCPVSKDISLKGFEIPCSSVMTKEDMLYIARQIKEICSESKCLIC